MTHPCKNMKTMRLLPMVSALLLVTFVTMGCTHQRHQNEVDRIRSEDDVRAFLRKHGSHSVASVDPFLIKECDTIRTMVTPYFKVDLDHNGQTDLIVNGRESVIVAMHQHDESYEIYVMPIESGALYGCEVDSVVDTDSLCFVYVSNRLIPCNNVFNYPRLRVVDGRDTLIGFEGRLLKYRPHKSSKRVTTIRLHTHGCFGWCPIYSMEIDSLGSVTYDAFDHTIPLGKYRGKIDSGSRSRIFRLADRIQPEQLDTFNDIPIDGESITLEFVFEDGSIKGVITDGDRDPGLRSLRGLLEDVRNANGWDYRRKH